MTGAAIAKKLRIPRSTVARILKRHGLERLEEARSTRAGAALREDPARRAHPPGHQETRAREGHRPPHHGPARGQTKNRGIGWEFVHVCIDDFTRLAYVEVLEDELGVTAVGFLRRAAAWFADQGVTVERVMTDNGSCYKSRAFAAAVADLGARHSRTRPYTPRTNGKAERFIQTLMREWAYARPFTSSYRRRAALPSWLRRYNERRPHAGIGGASPITRLRSAA